MPARAPTSAAITVSDVQTSPRVCSASAYNTSLARRSAARDSYQITNRFTATVTSMTTKLAAVIDGRVDDRPDNWLNALRNTSITTSSRKTLTAAAATVSYFRCPYG